MSGTSTILKNFFSLTAANAVSKITGLLTVVYLARVLGPGDFGKINFALAFISYFAMLAHLCVNAIGTRDISQRPAEMADTVDRILSLKLMLGAAAFLLLAATLPFTGQDPEMKRLVLFYGLTIFTSNVLPMEWVFQGLEKMEYQGLASVIQGLIYMTLIFLAVNGGEDLRLVPFVLLAAQGGAVAYLYRSLKKLRPDFTLRVSMKVSLETVRQALPAAAWGVTSVITLNAGVTILGFMSGPEQVGYFSAAHKIIWIFAETMTAYAAAVFPAIAREHLRDPESARRTMDQALRWTALLAFPALTGVFMLAEPVISTLYSATFSGSALILSLLAPVPYLVFLMNLFILFLFASHRQDRVIFLGTFQAVLTVALSFALIPRYGAIGLAAATTAGIAVSNAVFAWEARRIAPLCFSSALKPLAASALMAAALHFMPGFGLAAGIASGAAVYAAAIITLGGVSAEDLKKLRAFTRTGPGDGGCYK